MLTNKPIIIIQNTNYHFETAISIYQSLLNLNLNVYFCCLEKEIFLQKKFLSELKIKLATKDIVEEACCGFVVSAYPYPNIPKKKAVPNLENNIFKKLENKVIFISHTFQKESDYNQKINKINKQNSLCLSPIANKIGVDYFYPIDIPIQKKYLQISDFVYITIQGHFESKRRDSEIIYKLIENLNNNIIVNFLGTSIELIKSKINKKFYKEIASNKFRFYKNTNELLFYQIINNTNFIMPCINDKIDNSTYANQRYSSNFNLSLALEKPLFCHDFFKNVYKIPGIYYNEKNFIEKLNFISNLKEAQYLELTNDFKLIKKEYREHNDKILEKKIKYIIEK